jgi:hypothetical protein
VTKTLLLIAVIQVFLMSLLYAAGPAESGAVIHVSPTGDDSNPGAEVSLFSAGVFSGHLKDIR